MGHSPLPPSPPPHHQSGPEHDTFIFPSDQTLHESRAKGRGSKTAIGIRRGKQGSGLHEVEEVQKAQRRGGKLVVECS